jgi:N4-(beta-N-acetylglucosaminyl)-L-asparaginase
MNTKGDFGGYALQKGFTYAVQTKSGSRVFHSKSFY